MRPGNVRPRAIKPTATVPLSNAAAMNAHVPIAMPATTAVPPERLTAQRQAFGSASVNRTSSGSVARPREALSANAYVT